MIIKSMSRKNTSFDQLVFYLNHGADEQGLYLAYNFLSDPQDTESIIKQFEDNGKLLPNRKNGIYMYHEIISLPTQGESPKQTDGILADLAQQYINKRCPDNLVYARIHNNTDKPHIHLAISSNKVMDSKRLRLSKKKFRSIQIQLEQYKLEKYPQLGRQEYYSLEHHSQRAKTNEAEQQINKQGKVTQKQRITNILSEALNISITLTELQSQVKKHNLVFYQRGKTVGVLDQSNNRNYRLKTLGLANQYQKLKQAVTQVEKQRQQLQQLRQSQFQQQHEHQNQSEHKP